MSIPGYDVLLLLRQRNSDYLIVYTGRGIVSLAMTRDAHKLAVKYCIWSQPARAVKLWATECGPCFAS